MRISVIGLGTVGIATKLGLGEFHDVIGYDIDGRGDWDEVVSSELTFVCVNTDSTEDSSLDMSNVINVCSRLFGDEYSGLVVVKSTASKFCME